MPKMMLHKAGEITNILEQMANGLPIALMVKGVSP